MLPGCPKAHWWVYRLPTEEPEPLEETVGLRPDLLIRTGFSNRNSYILVTKRCRYWRNFWCRLR